MPKANRSFAGEWRIVELSDTMEDYDEPGNAKPFIRLKASYEDRVNGEYDIGLCTGAIDGAVRSFGGETIVVFGFDGSDEMDPASGGGWMRLLEDGKLEGEFVNHLGKFVGKRITPRRKISAKRK
ncbi:MAG: hypothetical protein AAB427_05785 [Chloroflexota bacterium]